jgi:outer membrane protein TolC
MPLYEGGQIYSQTRQAQEKVAQSQGLTDDARRQAVQSAIQSWETLQSANASAYSLQATIAADEIALEGVRQEQQVGSRTILDVLNQEQELFTDQVSLVQAQHDGAVAEFNLAQQIGALNAASLGLPVKLYDTNVHYKSVRDKWIGFGAKD